MIRATTGGVLRGYRRNLMSSFIGLNKARDTALTQRTFNSYAEDPASAAKAFKLRKARMGVETHYDICDDTYHRYQAAYSSLQTIDKELDTENGSESLNTLKGTTLKMLNDPTGDAREQLTKVLDQISEAIVQNMNQKYGDNFIFAGADGHNVPFEIKDSKLYYRGVSVDAAVPELFEENGAGTTVTLNANGEVDATGDRFLLAGAKTISQTAYDAMVTNHNNDPTADPPPELLKSAGGAAPASFVDDDGNTYYIIDDSSVNTMTQEEIDQATQDAEKLEYLANEKYFVDIGLGFQENENGQLIESSGYNASLPGISFFGYGVDEDGDPKNIYSIVQKLKEIGARVHDGEQWTNADYEEFKGLVGKLETASSNFKTEFTNLAAGTTKLENNLKILTDDFDSLQEQYSNLEDVDMADAITSFIWAQYCYNAALKVGNSVLSESLMDYLS
ncbi:MAG: hypothetical protein HDT38_03845 [Clostridiales bacterium]|nr:hypothetical protein [Clostridiales bacterium]